MLQSRLRPRLYSYAYILKGISFFPMRPWHSPDCFESFSVGCQPLFNYIHQKVFPHLPKLPLDLFSPQIFTYNFTWFFLQKKLIFWGFRYCVIVKGILPLEWMCDRSHSNIFICALLRDDFDSVSPTLYVFFLQTSKWLKWKGNFYPPLDCQPFPYQKMHALIF